MVVRGRLTTAFYMLPLLLLFAAFAAQAQGADQRAFREIARLGRGINILGYDGIWQGATNAPFRWENLIAIRKAGFSHVRINFFGFKYMDSKNRLDPAVLRRLDMVIHEVLASRLIPILDEHDSDFCQRYVSKCTDKLKSFWKQIASRYAGKYPSLVFEILNEPGGQMTAAAWNSLLNACLGIVRSSNPQRFVIAAALNTEAGSIEKLALPATDRNLIVTFHYYAPIEFTHQGAPWSRTFSKLGPIDWGTPEDKAKVLADFRTIKAWADRERRPIYLGEFGVYERAPSDSRRRYLSFLARTAERFGWAWAYWQFDHDFAAFDTERQTWHKGILDALIPGSH